MTALLFLQTSPRIILSVLYETGVIVAAGVLLNYVGLTLSRHMESILFLDMTGTALVAFLLGPWWGAIVALLSNSVVNWLLYPELGADVVIFPWSLVNMTGALFWGVLARQPGFQKYVRTSKSSVLAHTWIPAQLRRCRRSGDEHPRHIGAGCAERTHHVRAQP